MATKKELEAIVTGLRQGWKAGKKENSELLRKNKLQKELIQKLGRLAKARSADKDTILLQADDIRERDEGIAQLKGIAQDLQERSDNQNVTIQGLTWDVYKERNRISILKSSWQEALSRIETMKAAFKRIDQERNYLMDNQVAEIKNLERVIGEQKDTIDAGSDVRGQIEEILESERGQHLTTRYALEAAKKQIESLKAEVKGLEKEIERLKVYEPGYSRSVPYGININSPGGHFTPHCNWEAVATLEATIAVRDKVIKTHLEEKAKLEKVTKWLLGKAMRKAKHYLILKDVKWDKDKITRIVTRLQPRYATHSIFHRQGMGEYEHQLLRIPSGSHDDLPDAAQIVVQLLKSPKGKKKVVHDDDDFEWHRKRLIAKKNKKTFFFGNKKNRDQFPLRCEDTLH